MPPPGETSSTALVTSYKTKTCYECLHARKREFQQKQYTIGGYYRRIGRHSPPEGHGAGHP